MKTSNISFKSWHGISYQQLKKLSPEEALRLGITIGKLKTQKDIYSGVSGFYIDIAPKKENRFWEICDSYDIRPTKEKL